jgi:hypothetical protein
MLWWVSASSKLLLRCPHVLLAVLLAVRGSGPHLLHAGRLGSKVVGCTPYMP